MSLQTQLLEAFKRHDKDGLGWLRIKDLQTLLKDTGLDDHWAEEDVRHFAEYFCREQAEDDNNSSGASYGQQQFDYPLFVDFVFFPVVAPGRSKWLKLNITRLDVARTTSSRVHCGRLEDSTEVTVKELVHIGQSDNDSVTNQAPDAYGDVTPSEIAEFRQHVNVLRLVTHPNLCKHLHLESVNIDSYGHVRLSE
ncbi:hypothetical protein PINS_up020463 [Pythium insidiosum]|nr:hypothetical protein PINS_up020463 [Pythium insidiosum]